jgi:hypothetical protein
VSSRHRDGIDWIDPPNGADRKLLRELALRKRDPYQGSRLLATVEAAGRIRFNSGAEDLILEIVHASTLAYQRSLLSKLTALLSQSEELFADAVLGGSPTETAPGSSATSQLLRLITVVGHLSPEVRQVRDAFSRGAQTVVNPRSEEILANYDLILTQLERLRGDARTAVDMFSSTISSAQLELSRTEARAAADERTRQEQEATARRKSEDDRRDREQRLVRAVTLGTSALLIPTLVASVFGANVKLPREGSAWETWLMISCMVGLGSLTFAVLRDLDPARGRSGGARRYAPYVLAVVALAVAGAIAVTG